MEVLTGSETLQALCYMGVDLPPTTRLPDDVLDKRLHDALNFSQHKSSIPSSINPDATQKWHVIQPLHTIFHRSDLQEAEEVESAQRAGGTPLDSDRPLFEDVFWDLMLTMLDIGLTIDNGRLWFVIQDVEVVLCTIMCRVLDTIDVGVDTPAVVLNYRAFTKEDGFESAPWCRYQINREKELERTSSIGDPLNGVVCIQCSRLEMRLLLKLLSMNASLLSPEYTPAKGPHEEQFKTSTLFPLDSLSFDALGTLNSDSGCAVCGKKQTSRCSQCDHFPAAVHDDDAAPPPPPNIHGKKTFLVKLQAPLGIPESVIMLYDRQRSFQEVFFYREDAPVVYDLCIAEIRGPRGGYEGCKMYRWARRTGDRQLSLCLDQEPHVEIKW